MRLELEPLKIRTITLVLGLVETNFHPSQTYDPLPKSSYWAPINDFMRERALHVPAQPKPSKAEDIAKSLVDKIDNGSRGKIYLGTLAWPVFKYIQWWLPTSLWVRISRGIVYACLLLWKTN